MIPASIRPIFSLCFCESVQQYTSTRRRLFILVQSTPTTSSEHWGGLDCVSRHSPRSFLAASKGFTVHSRRLYSRQDQAQSISNDCQSNHEKYEFNQSLKYFEIRPSQPRNTKNFGEGSVGCLKITSHQKTESKLQTQG